MWPEWGGRTGFLPLLFDFFAARNILYKCSVNWIERNKRITKNAKREEGMGEKECVFVADRCCHIRRTAAFARVRGCTYVPLREGKNIPKVICNDLENWDNFQINTINQIYLMKLNTNSLFTHSTTNLIPLLYSSNFYSTHTHIQLIWEIKCLLQSTGNDLFLLSLLFLPRSPISLNFSTYFYLSPLMINQLTWISMWWGSSINLSISILSSPKDAMASALLNVKPSLTYHTVICIKK